MMDFTVTFIDDSHIGVQADRITIKDGCIIFYRLTESGDYTLDSIYPVAGISSIERVYSTDKPSEKSLEEREVSSKG